MYTIYHIPGVKIGCTEQSPQDRVKDQGHINYEVLEEHTDVYIASDRELELQKQYGLPVDKKPYWQVIKMPTPYSRRKGGKVSGRKNVKTGDLLKASSLGGKASGKKVGAKLYKEGKGLFSMTEEDKLKARQKGGLLGGSKGGKKTASIERTCPHCNKILKGPTYFVWHGDKCKAKPQ
jgi:hypothetical protein